MKRTSYFQDVLQKRILVMKNNRKTVMNCNKKKIYNFLLIITNYLDFQSIGVGQFQYIFNKNDYLI